MPTVGIYTIEVEQSNNTRTFNNVTKPLWNCSITNNETGQTIEMDDLAEPTIREDWCDTVFKHAKEGLDSDEGPDCCYVAARYAE
jgi:hypothetical protein